MKTRFKASGPAYRNEAGRLRHNERQRVKQREAYRLKHGIPLNAPVLIRGPKVGHKIEKAFASQPLKYYWR